MEEYYLEQDNNCHWYVIPLSKQKEWDEWLDIPGGDERSWEAPEFVEQVGGGPSLVIFKHYKIQ